MRSAKHIVVAVAISMAACGAVFAQGARDGRYPVTTGSDFAAAHSIASRRVERRIRRFRPSAA